MHKHKDKQMNIFSKVASSVTPYLYFSAQDGVMEIKGKSISDDPDLFWNEAILWFENYVLTPQSVTIFKIDLEYFNIASSKRILFLLYKLNEITNKGFAARVEWFYRSSDLEMFEVGQDYAFMVKVPFEFKEINDSTLAIAM